MKLRIWHLFAIVTLVAIVIHFSNEATFSSMKVQVAAAHELPDPSFPLVNSLGGDYCLLLEFPDYHSEALVYVSSNFDKCLAFSRPIAKRDIAELPSLTFQLRYRAKPFLFAEPETLTQAVERRFNDVLWVVFP